MRVSELSGDLLDYWVARAEGIEHGPDLREMRPGGVLIKVWSKEGFTFYTAYTPSTDVAQAWPIILRKRIDIYTAQDDGADIWGAYCNDSRTAFLHADPLVAAMRARVFAEYGETVPAEVPA
ncbi:uncharacterized protein DUF2591 [Paraburkholderia fungorum]|jgi:hypothetical protein|uniref:phage protein NinX family protein n=1 Tax=Paraburkholderia fungorum TaxID=134537 RepID=UPI000D07914F|nr:phage protein NinX family protein [Paraburkholderia fungorum]PRZ51204.1 uncharacterized protein DUF2591 [Paraburkholderia fungorum]